jgi:hypothetical protein
MSAFCECKRYAILKQRPHQGVDSLADKPFGKR